MAEMKRQVVEQASSFALGIVPSIVDEDGAQSGPPKVKQYTIEAGNVNSNEFEAVLFSPKLRARNRWSLHPFTRQKAACSG